MSIVKEGRPFILPPLALGSLFIAVSAVIGPASAYPLGFGILLGLGILLLVFALFCLFFFRDPAITVAGDENHVLSPCNGTVLQTEEDENEKVVRVFLSIFNVHLQRSPVRGRVKSLEHRDGKFLMAWDPLAHSLNEQNIFTIENERGLFTVRQIAGFLARRCVSWVKTGDELTQGEKIGCIKFSSQVDLHLPKSVEIKVQPGDPVRAGITIVGEMP
ncbi:MAG: phosphatidylserine decarboxylase [Treponema sp.]|jgi:phosphatidylserine decarboxylase|nr:phosphatidylserine decarboxylase [Treponema sp.]